MISIIISSYKEDYYNKVVASVQATIGVPYEIVKVENRNLFSIAKAYNQGAARAKYEVLCFVHEDVLFKTQDWGQNILNHLKDPDLGLIGVAGSAEIPSMAFSWPNPTEGSNKLYILQHKASGAVVDLNTSSGSAIDFVKVLDGVFLSTTKKVWQEIPFDENIEGYHLYDIDYSLRIAQRYKVAVVYDVLLEHFSSGTYGDDWLLATLKYHKTRTHLVHTKPTNVTTYRQFIYNYLFVNNMSLKYRLLYVKNIGIDKKNISLVFRFLTPNLYLNLYAFLEKIGLVKKKL